MTTVGAAQEVGVAAASVQTETGHLERAGRRRAVPVVATAVAAVVLFLGYLRLARVYPINADAASNALQAWEMLHGNVLLRGWTLSDVSFYTTELPQYALVELVYGYHADVVHVVAAMTYTLLVLLAAALAKGRATGVEAALRVGIVLAIMLVPLREMGYLTLLSGPNHTGTGVPLLVTWLVLDRALTTRDGRAREAVGRWLPYAIAVLLTWGQIGDPLVMYIGVLPLVAVCAFRLWRGGTRWPHRWRGVHARLLVAGLASVVVTHAVLAAVRLAGGFAVYAPTVRLSPVSQLGHRASMTVANIAAVYGAYFPELDGPVAVSLGVLHLVGILAALAAVCVVVIRMLRGPVPHGRAQRESHFVCEVLAVAVAVNVGAYLVSTLPDDLNAARQVAVVLPMGAVLAGRICAPRLRGWRLAPVLAAVLVVMVGAFAVQAATARPVPAPNTDVARWLVSRNLSYGIGSYWNANNVTLLTEGRVRVAPVHRDAAGRIRVYHWESRDDWYDPARHDARFLVLDTGDHKHGGAVEEATAQFGTPVEHRAFGRFVVLVFDHNLLAGLPDG